MDKDFAEMHATMQKWCDAQKVRGWQSREVETCARRVLLGLWVAPTRSVSAASLRQFAKDTEALAKARSNFPTIA